MLQDTTSAQLIARYGYLAILAGTFLEGETVVLVAGFLAHQGYLSLSWIVFFAVLGSTISDQGLFFLSRFRGMKFLARFPKALAKAGQLSEKMRSRPAALAFFALFFRFFYGLRNISPIVLGLSDIPTLRFMALNVIGAALWACAFSSLGYIFARTLESFMGALAKFEMAIVLVLFAAGGAFAVYRRWRRTPPSGAKDLPGATDAETPEPKPHSTDGGTGRS